jgi:hypothetical protein
LPASLNSMFASRDNPGYCSLDELVFPHGNPPFFARPLDLRGSNAAGFQC